MSANRFIVCTSGYGRFGIGLHFAQMVEESRAAGDLYGYMATRIKPGDESRALLLPPPAIRRLPRYVPLRISPATWYNVLSSRFEKRIAGLMPLGPDTLMTFAGRSELPARKSRELGYQQVELISANSHISNVEEKHRLAGKVSGIADSWVNGSTADKIRREYDLADKIYVHSDYVRRSFIDRGVDPEKLVRTRLVPNPRFVPPAGRTDDGVFRVVYVGRIDSSKGISLLINAFKKMKRNKAELRLVGGWTSRAMKEYLIEEIRDDPRITVKPGDPLPVLHKADVLVHASFEDGFAYAPLEALCCGVPVIVTEDTGMKEHVIQGENGYIVPTGHVDPIVDYLDKIADTPPSFDAKKLRSAFYS